MLGFLKHDSAIELDSQRCPNCDNPITPESVNIKEGVALCSQCGKISWLSELNYTGRTTAEILANPPAGCSIVADGQRVTVAVSLRSFRGFLAIAGVALFWNGITSIFVSLAIAGLYTNLIGPLPNWFPTLDANDGKPEVNGQPMGLGMALFLSVFITPFVAVGAMMASFAILKLCGKIEVVIEEFSSSVATRVGFLRWTKRFDSREVKKVEFGVTTWQSNGSPNTLIEIKGNRCVKFGSMLDSEHLEWLLMLLRELLLRGNETNRVPGVPVLTWLLRRTQE